MMTFYFGKIDLEEFTHEDVEDTFIHNGNYYWYKATTDEDGFNIYDTCGRHMPMDYDSGPALATVLFGINTVEKARKDAEQMLAKKMREVSAVVEFYNE